MARRAPSAEELPDSAPKRALKLRMYVGLVAGREQHTFLSLLIQYGPVTALYVLSWLFVVWGPTLNVNSWFYDWVPRYVIVGFVIGVSVFGRLWLRQWLRVWAWRHKTSAWIGRKPSPPRGGFSDMTYMLRYTLTVLVVTFLSVLYGLLMAIFWPLFLPAEVGIWTETRGHR